MIFFFIHILVGYMLSFLHHILILQFYGIYCKHIVEGIHILQHNTLNFTYCLLKSCKPVVDFGTPIYFHTTQTNFLKCAILWNLTTTFLYLQFVFNEFYILDKTYLSFISFARVNKPFSMQYAHIMNIKYIIIISILDTKQYFIDS